jgi:hypothetical protein
LLAINSLMWYSQLDIDGGLAILMVDWPNVKGQAMVLWCQLLLLLKITTSEKVEGMCMGVFEYGTEEKFEFHFGKER